MLRFDGSPGEFLRAQRKRLRLSQAALAHRVNLSRETIKSIEGGRRRFQPEHTRRFADVLEIPIEQYQAFARFIEQHAGERSADPAPDESPEVSFSLGSAGGEELGPDVSARLKPSLLSSIYATKTYLWTAAGVLALTCLGAVFWLSRQPSVATASLGLLSFQFNQPRCEHDAPDSLFQWHQGSSADSQCSVIGNTFVITAGAQTIQDTGGNYSVTAPLLTRRVEGDFRAQVMITYDGGPLCCRHAGFGLRLPGDNTTWLRIDKESRDYQITAGGLIYGLTTMPDIAPDDAPFSHGKGPVWLQIERQRSTLTMRYSYDGKQWVDYYTYPKLPSSDVWELFLMVEAAYFPPSSHAAFSHFSLEAPAPR